MSPTFLVFICLIFLNGFMGEEVRLMRFFIILILKMICWFLLMSEFFLVCELCHFADEFVLVDLSLLWLIPNTYIAIPNFTWIQVNWKKFVMESSKLQSRLGRDDLIRKIQKNSFEWTITIQIRMNLKFTWF